MVETMILSSMFVLAHTASFTWRYNVFSKSQDLKMTTSMVPVELALTVTAFKFDD